MRETPMHPAYRRPAEYDLPSARAPGAAARVAVRCRDEPPQPATTASTAQHATRSAFISSVLQRSAARGSPRREAPLDGGELVQQRAVRRQVQPLDVLDQPAVRVEAPA